MPFANSIMFCINIGLCIKGRIWIIAPVWYLSAPYISLGNIPPKKSISLFLSSEVRCVISGSCCSASNISTVLFFGTLSFSYCIDYFFYVRSGNIHLCLLKSSMWPKARLNKFICSLYFFRSFYGSLPYAWIYNM